MAIAIDTGSPYNATSTSGNISVTPANGAGGSGHVWIAMASCSNASAFGTPNGSMSGGGLTWTNRARKIGANNSMIAEIWTATGTANGTAITWTASSANQGGALRVYALSGTATEATFPTATAGDAAGNQKLTMTVGAGSFLFAAGVDYTGGLQTYTMTGGAVLGDHFSNGDSDDIHNWSVTSATSAGSLAWGSTVPASNSTWVLAGIEVTVASGGLAPDEDFGAPFRTWPDSSVVGVW